MRFINKAKKWKEKHVLFVCVVYKKKPNRPIPIIVQSECNQQQETTAKNPTFDRTSHPQTRGSAELPSGNSCSFPVNTVSQTIACSFLIRMTQNRKRMRQKWQTITIMTAHATESMRSRLPLYRLDDILMILECEFNSISMPFVSNRQLIWLKFWIGTRSNWLTGSFWWFVVFVPENRTKLEE